MGLLATGRNLSDLGKEYLFLEVEVLSVWVAASRVWDVMDKKE